MTAKPPSSPEQPPQARPALGDPVIFTRRQWIIGGILGTAAALAGGYAALSRLTTMPESSLPFPPADPLWGITLPQPDGGTLQLTEFAGKPLIVNFWATWCAPCVEELPLLNAFHTQEADWQVVGIAVDTPENVQRFIERFSLQFPIGIAGAAGVNSIKELGNTSGGLPFTIMADRQGNIKARKTGQLHAADLAEWKNAVQ